MADLLEPEIPAVSKEILAGIPAEVPEYARPFEGSFGHGIQTGTGEALKQFLALVRDPDSGRDAGRAIYVELGRGEMRQGRSLDSLQAAYRIGARIAWRRLARRGAAEGVPQETLNTLAESIFAYIDEISAESVEGYALEQSLREGVRERERRRLLALLTTEAPDPDQLQAAALAASWELPTSIAALACDRDAIGSITRRLPAECFGTSVGGDGCIVIPDPAAPGRESQIASAVGTRPAALGPSGPVSAFWLSWSEALRANRQIRRSGLVRSEEIEFEVMLAENAARLARIRDRHLAPISELTPKGQERMLETLRSYLDHEGDITRIAEEIHLHPQTVRYRVGKLKELVGEVLDDPVKRNELTTALMSERVTAVVGGPDLPSGI